MYRLRFAGCDIACHWCNTTCVCCLL